MENTNSEKKDTGDICVARGGITSLSLQTKQ